MVYSSSDERKVAVLAVVVAVVDGVAFKLDVVGNGVSAQMVEGVVGAELFHVHSAVRHDVAHEVDVLQIAHDVELALAPCLHIVQEAATEVEQTAPQSEMGKVIESIERSAFSQAIAREAQAASTEQAVDPFAQKEEPKQEKKYRVRFFADGTKEQLGKLIAFMNENNIKYGKIAKESK